MTKETLIQGLNEDLTAELGNVIRYIYQTGKTYEIEGIFYRDELHKLFRKEIKDELEYSSLLTDFIIALGGEPMTKPKEFKKPDDLKLMLELDLKTESKNIKNYEIRARQAEEMGLIVLKEKLQEMAAEKIILLSFSSKVIILLRIIFMTSSKV